jgi:prepilin-type N-terminal cleavage/methylation domain-containing protein
MANTKTKIKYAKGFGLIEVMATILILLIAVTGSLAYQYHTALNARKADLYATASRLGNAMLETWKGLGSDTTFNPATVFSTEMNIASNGTAQPPANLSDTLGSYLINENNANYYITLSYQDAPSKARVLNVAIVWGQKDHGKASFAQTDNSITWSTCQGY